ncbi:hypothetical protein [Teichococcus aestuarii]|uniref:hypothetical protein n=1 Tax=Teichococcus aestuarii TaxID=568898 RepID=UPI00360F57E3
MSRIPLLSLRAPAALSAGALQRHLLAWKNPLLLARRRGEGGLPGWSRRAQAQERLLDDMADRIARLEIALLREQRQAQEQALRADQAEASIIRLQSMLDSFRQHQACRNGVFPRPTEAHAS